MKSFCLMVMVVALFGFGVSARCDIYSLIQQGQVDDALDSISALGSTFAEHGNVLFFRGLITSDADSSALLLDSARGEKVDPRFEEVIASRLAWYYLSEGDMKGAEQEAATYLQVRKDGAEAAAMSRILILAHERRDESTTALAAADQYQTEFPQGETSQWGVIDRARLAGTGGYPLTVTKALKRIARDTSGAVAPVALECLTKRALMDNRPEDAVTYFTALKQQFPYAVGLEAIADKISELPETESKDDQAEKITGTYYAVRVGLFASKENAARQAQQCRPNNEPYSIDTKDVGGKRYFVVYVGRFRDFDDAQAFKQKLEAQMGETFQVTAR